MSDLASRLREAEERAVRLFDAIENRGLIQAGVSESELSDRVHALAGEMFGTPTWWHRRVIRAGKNTLCPYREHPPDLRVQEDDIVFVDLGPVFEGYEADFGKTWVLGDDPSKQKMARDVETVFRRGREFFESNPDTSAAELFHRMGELAAEHGWQLGSEHTGHLIGEFPHEKLRGDKLESYIHPDNPRRLRGHFDDGTPLHWILEAHLVDPERQFGGFYEALLNA